VEDRIKNENLLRTIKLKLCTTPVKSYKEIEDLDVTNKNFLGNILNIDLKEIVKLENLKTLSLKYFEINDEVIESINNLKYLYKIEFYMCEFKTCKQLNNNINDITIYCCSNFEYDILRSSTNIESLELTNSGLVDLNELQHCKKIKALRIRDCSLISLPKISNLVTLEYLYLNNINLELDFDIGLMHELKFISFSGSKNPNKEDYINKIKKLNSNIEIEWRDDDLPIE